MVVIASSKSFVFEGAIIFTMSFEMILMRRNFYVKLYEAPLNMGLSGLLQENFHGIYLIISRNVFQSKFSHLFYINKS